MIQKYTYHPSDYRIIKKIGIGGFSEVYKVQDPHGNYFALKKIQKNDSDILDYIYTEIFIMKELSHPDRDIQLISSKHYDHSEMSTNPSQRFAVSDSITQLIDEYEDQEYIYLILQYCDGGDLRNEMERNSPEPIIPLNQAKEIIASILKGLELIHSRGFVHRDIKVENILVNNIRDSSGKVKQKKYKISDFGVSKCIEKNKARTVLGTRQYMSPEIFQEEEYGFEIDMWALGVLFCFILNRSYPFKINPYLDGLNELGEWIKKQANNFSYKEYVTNTKYGKIENCTEEMEDLFRKIFQLDPSKRLTFIEIREHPVFQGYFQNDKYSEIRLKGIYSKKVGESEIIKKFAMKQAIPIKNLEQSEQYNLVLSENSKVEFLIGCFHELEKITKIDAAIKISALYNIIKYYLIRKKNFIIELKTGKICEKFPDTQMVRFMQSDTIKMCISKFEEQFNQGTFKFEEYEGLSRQYLPNISLINSDFERCMQQVRNFREIDLVNFDGAFKQCYRKSTMELYHHFLKKYQNTSKSKEKYCEKIVIVQICHFANRIFSDLKITQKIFKKFWNEKCLNEHPYLLKLRKRIRKAKYQDLLDITNEIHQAFR